MEKGEGRKGERGGMVRVAMSMVLVQVFQTGMAILSKLALDQGMSVLPFLVYRNAIGAVSVACLAFFIQRNDLAKLTKEGIMWVFLNGLFGLTLGMSFFYYGLRDTTAAYSSIFLNLIPVATFILSVVLRTEKLGIMRLAGVLKVSGTLVCVGGAMIISLYKGKSLHVWSFHFEVFNDAGVRAAVHDYTGGTLFLVASCFCYACWFILQVKLARVFPSLYWGTSLSCLAGCIQSAIVGMVVNQKRSEWALTTKLQLVIALYSGILNVGVTFILVTWAVSKRGPTFPPMFSPLSLVFVTIIESLFMGFQLTIGSIIGMILIIAGIYAFLWGKLKEAGGKVKLTTQSAPDLGTSNIGLEPHQASIQITPDPKTKSED